MNRKLFSIFILSCLSAVALLTTGPLWAQTGDDIVPAVETDCDGDPFSFGLCNAYCEALDCDSETPIGSERACARVLDNYMNKSDGILPPCENQCPCAFDVQADYESLVADANAAWDPDLDPTSFESYCLDYFGNDRFELSEFQPPEIEYGIRMYYYIEPEDDPTPAMCVEEGGGVDGVVSDFLGYFPFHRSESLTADEEIDCIDKLAQLCASIMN